MVKKIKIIFTRGMQASGKSWWAKEFVKNNQDWKRVCRDDIRHQLSSYTFDDKNEKLVTLVEENTIDILINQGYNIIIDSMNLHKERLEKRINEYVRKYKELDNIDIEVEIKNFPIEINEAIMRDKLRDFSLGEKVLKRTWHKYKNELIEMIEESKPKVEYDPNLSDAVCFDVDGTLFNRKNRSPFDFTKVEEDEPIKIVFEQMSFHSSKGRTIYVFSGRDDSCRDVTHKQISENYDGSFYLFMRKTGDSRRDSIVKREMYERFIKGQFNLIAVYDDRPQVLNETWRELGIFTFDVGRGVEF